MKRFDGREYNELRRLKVTHNIYEYTPGSVLLELGKTKVLCAVTLQPTVPHFLRGKGTGWLTAEYALLPASTSYRTQREISIMKRHHRSVEISRLISRSIRTAVDLSVLGERSIMIDCDVLQADGGTRTASIIAAFAALSMAQRQWKADGIITQDIIKHGIGAISVGVMEDHSLVLDPDYQEDFAGVADINFIMTYTGDVIEVQGGAEKEPIAWQKLIAAGELAQKGIQDIAQFFQKETRSTSTAKQAQEQKAQKTALFSLQRRQPDSSL